MIKNIVFDFGDVFINLDKEATISELFKLGVDEISFKMMEVAQKYEIGNLTNQEFIDEFTSMFPAVSDIDFINAWNSILKDFPKHRLDFLKSLAESKKYRIFLLSNTNDLHISWVQENWGHELFAEFKNCFEQFYLSHEMNLRKPNANIYEFVLKENNLIAEETFFIDDTEENTRTAEKLGIKVWNINPTSEDVVDLLARKEFNS
tara:strand:+ start:17267 stop:17881 length:615 start_codon:yes stop_codon:yes gene_type:complete